MFIASSLDESEDNTKLYVRYKTSFFIFFLEISLAISLKLNCLREFQTLKLNCKNRKQSLVGLTLSNKVPVADPKNFFLR